jgi:hypothetical protein
MNTLYQDTEIFFRKKQTIEDTIKDPQILLYND